MHLIYNNCLKDHALLEATYDAALLSKSTDSQVSRCKLWDWALQTSYLSLSLVGIPLS